MASYGSRDFDNREVRFDSCQLYIFSVLEVRGPGCVELSSERMGDKFGRIMGEGYRLNSDGEGETW